MMRRERPGDKETRVPADGIAEMADSGRDIARFFADQGTVKQPLTSISLDITQERREGRPQEVPLQAAMLRISRQAAVHRFRRCARSFTDFARYARIYLRKGYP